MDEEKILINGKEFRIGQRIRIISAKSVLHYSYGMVGNEDEDMKGLIGVITSKSTYCKYARANIKVDEPYQDRYKNGRSEEHTSELQSQR